MSLVINNSGIGTVAIGGTTIFGGTPGSVLFVDSGGYFGQDNSHFFWDDTNNRLGIGTSSPSGFLHVTSGAAATVASIFKGASSQSANLTEWQNSSGSVLGSISADGTPSFPGLGSTSERFGAGSTANGLAALSVGYFAHADGVVSTAIGFGAGADFDASVSIGTASAITAIGGVAIGYNATAGENAFALGRQCTVAASHLGSMAVGFALSSTAANQLVMGGVVIGYDLRDIYFGSGVTNASPQAVTLQITGGSGTNIAGPNLSIAGSKATGNATGGSILFKTSDAGSSGTTLQSLTTKMTVLASGNVGIGDITPDNILDVGDGTGTKYLAIDGASSGSAGGSALRIQNNGADIGVIGNKSAVIGGAYDANLALFTTGQLQFLTGSNTTPKMVIEALGNVGIGTASPTQGKVQITNDSTYNVETSSGLAIIANSSDSELLLGADATNDICFIQSAQQGTSFATRPLCLNPNSGNVGIGTTSPTAYLHLAAGTTAASTAPLKFTSGTNLTSAEAGAVEWDGTNIFISQTSGPTRKTIAYTTDIPTTASGVYTPTRSAESNLDANVTMSEAQYLRVGSTVTVSGRFTADPTTTLTATSFEFTLPVASNIGAVEDAAGVAFCGAIASQGAQISGSVANNTAVVTWVATDVTNQTWSYTLTYQVI